MRKYGPAVHFYGEQFITPEAKERLQAKCLDVMSELIGGLNKKLQAKYYFDALEVSAKISNKFYKVVADSFCDDGIEFMHIHIFEKVKDCIEKCHWTAKELLETEFPPEWKEIDHKHNKDLLI